MPVFRARNRVEILRDMVARVVARSRLTGLVRQAVVYHILAASADEIAEGNFQLANLRKLWSIDNATGSDLDERAREIQPGTITRIQALYANGTVVFSRPGTTGTVTIPAGTIVAADDGNGLVRFRTSSAVQILAGSTTSAAAPVTAIEAGSRGNVSAGTIVKMVSRIPGVTGVTNGADLTNGLDRENDETFRSRIKAYVRSLARGTITAIETAVKNARLTDGSRVVFAKAVEDAFSLGRVYVYIDDATGAIDTYDETYLSSWDVVVPAALGGERHLFTTQKPIRDDGSFVFQINGVTQTRDVDYVLNPATGQISLDDTVYPTGLTAADVARAQYRSYTRLIREAQRIIDGDPLVPRTYPGVRAAGTFHQVLPPQRVAQTLSAGIVVQDGFDPLEVATAVATAIQEYINGLDIGDDVIVAEIIQRAMEVPGMLDINITELSGSTPPTNQVIQEYQVARIGAGDISLI